MGDMYFITTPVCTAAGTIVGTTDLYELCFSYLSINIFNEFGNSAIKCKYKKISNMFKMNFTYFSNVICLKSFDHLAADFLEQMAS